MTFLHARTATDAEVVIDHGYKIGRVGYGHDHIIDSVGAAASAAVADARFILAGIEIRMIGLVHKPCVLCPL